MDAAVMDHILFHKAIIDEGDDGSRFDRYIELAARQSSDNIRDPMDKAFFHLFDVVVKEGMDPWSIDLKVFCKEYLKRLRADDPVNFIVTGRIIFLAYRILRLKSDRLAERAVAEEEQPQEPVWDIPSWFDQPVDVDYSGRVLKGDIPLAPAFATEKVRPVGLMELVDALEEARAEAQIQLRISEYRRKHRRSRTKAVMRAKLHEENIADDIERTWERITRLGDGRILLHDLFADDMTDLVTVFMSLLFLAQMGKVSLSQSRKPAGEIVVQVLETEEAAPDEEFSVTVVKEPRGTAPTVKIDVTT